MFHGTLDPIVPFNSGFPFTIDVALPIVYGSNSIHSKLNELNIENELHIGQGELHEYWGALNGNWFGGPNEYYTQITNDSYSFLYNQLDFFNLGDINQDSEINVLDVVLAVNMVIGLEDTNDSADINTDGEVDILDIVQLINIILED